MENCCWNMKNHPHLGHNGDCLATYGPQFRDATMAVTFTDDVTKIYKNVRVCINRLLPSGAEDDGINIDGTTIRFEAGDASFTVLGVRQYTYTLDNEECEHGLSKDLCEGPQHYPYDRDEPPF